MERHYRKSMLQQHLQPIRGRPFRRREIDIVGQ